MEAATVTDLPKIEAEDKSDAYMRWLDLQDTLDGIRTAAKRHDAQARQKYYKPFKRWKFNRAKRQR